MDYFWEFCPGVMSEGFFPGVLSGDYVREIWFRSMMSCFRLFYLPSRQRSNDSGARHGSSRENICSDGKFSWVESRIDFSRADIMCQILFSFFVFYKDGKELKRYHLIEQ